jgi:lipoate-protein ligase A
MLYCDLTFPTPEENLACDEALLEWCENGSGDEVLRSWEPDKYFVVVGYANKVAVEANLPFCRQNTIPILRRCSGGGTVLQGPGCLNYSLVLRITGSGPLHSISTTNAVILDRHQAALTTLLRAPVEKQGHTDLAIGGLKFSGNAQRRRKHYLLFHGCFLLNADIGLIERALRMPSQQPRYRAARSHSDFLLNLKIPSHSLKPALVNAWEATELATGIPFAEIARLVLEKYCSQDWNYKF